MKTITVCKADEAGGVEVEAVTLDIGTSIPKWCTTPDWESRSRDFYRDQAQTIYGALKSLPGGTVDALLVVLLERKISLLRVQ